MVGAGWVETTSCSSSAPLDLAMIKWTSKWQWHWQRGPPPLRPPQARRIQQAKTTQQAFPVPRMRQQALPQMQAPHLQEAPHPKQAQRTWLVIASLAHSTSRMKGRASHRIADLPRWLGLPCSISTLHFFGEHHHRGRLAFKTLRVFISLSRNRNLWRRRGLRLGPPPLPWLLCVVLFHEGGRVRRASLGEAEMKRASGNSREMPHLPGCPCVELTWFVAAIVLQFW